ncbi:helix-turn-helix transcriptional regulator [Streptomyces albipurpureus]|uniref:AraC family transcriptional regulator n=1 Tax=Streptomyces albipurpureus TaxID=2897419 RepID=A0ABT0UIQ4_9ACTN|nr:AraC family transcriptional regulator [Streptomyces sp. CWNU-1]MCM2388320.1 AraC family transcriptional regulator [Streptomyces sp. CWNU-1]
MDEYASARLVGLVQGALAAEGIHTVAPTGDGALLPFDAKRRFLTGVAREYGLLPLLRVGSLLSAHTSDPAVSALLSAVDPHDLFHRWQRLERFTHSRHRVEIVEQGPGRLVAEHVGPRSAPPEPAEDALVLGVLTALLSLTGAGDVMVTVGRDRPVTVMAHGAFTAPPPTDDSGWWRFTWSDAARDVRVRTADTGKDTVARTRRMLRADLARRWALADLATELRLPVRSIQRRLTGVGGFSGLIATVRTEAAAELLMQSRHPVGVVGFACGYADQPHFTRHFKRHTAMTPAAYRAAFRLSPPVQAPTRTTHP